MTDSQGDNKPHPCVFPGCTKSFTRAEHLRRHALNHEQIDTFCERCGVHFTRPDLLGMHWLHAFSTSWTNELAIARHLARHAKKDDEAGGPGLGVLETRKRARRGSDGRLIERPSKRMLRAGITTTVKRAISSDGTSSQEQQPQMSPPQAPVSPPRSSESSESYGGHGVDNLTHSTMDMELQEQLHVQSYDNILHSDGNLSRFDSAWVPDPVMPVTNDLFEDVFNPDTASSFNQPFTTMNNYNWLFDAPTMKDAFYTDDFANMSTLDAMMQPNANQYWSPTMQSIPPQISDPIEDNREDNRHHNTVPQLPSPSDERSSILSFPPHPTEQTHQSSNVPDSRPQDVSIPVSTTPSHASGSTSPNAVSTSATSLVAQTPQADRLAVPDNTENDWMGTEVAVTAHTTLPIITTAVRTSILDLICDVLPITLQGNKIDSDSPLLTVSSLQEFSDLFWTRFNTTYPLLHQATFDPSKTEPLLTISVLLLGATYSSRNAHQMAVGIHDTLRPRIFSHPSFAAEPDLWVLQTILLVECFGKSRAGLKQHDMSHLFHGMLINLIRRSDCQSINTSPAQSIPPETSLDLAWRSAMSLESRKRLAFLCFQWDVQHAQLFGQSLCMSAFELRSSLPCDSATWEASSAEEWLRQSRRENKTHHSFLKVLKGYITPSVSSRPRHLNALSRILLLHGLMSISWDLRRRDQTSLGADGDAAGSWKGRIARSYDLWLTDFDADCLNMKLNLMYDLRKFTGLKTATHAIYHAAHIVLNVEVLDLQIAAGAPHILGRKVGQADYDRSRRVIEKWMNEDVRGAAKAAWHASRIISDSVMNLNDWDDSDVFHYPWCLYLATLVCWAFHLPSSVNGGHHHHHLDDVPANEKSDINNNTSSSSLQQSSDTDAAYSLAKTEMTTLVVGMTSCKSVDDLSHLAGKFRTRGLTMVMSKQLATVRWAIVHDGMKVLNRLSGL